MAGTRQKLPVLSRLGVALNRRKFPSFCLKPLQVKCFEYVLKGLDVIAVLPTGFGKSLLFQLLPDFLPVKGDKNIVLVVCPLNSIIEDQLKVLENRGISADVLQVDSNQRGDCESLFPSGKNTTERESNTELMKLKSPNEKLMNGDVQIVFTHPEALLSKEGRKLMNSKVFKENVVACVVDEAHCVEIWGEEFRMEFKDLSAIRAFFPNIPIMALTATAPPHLLTSLKQSLSLNTNCKIISANPNRTNIYFDKKVRMSSHHGFMSFEQILLPIANELALQREKYPMTIIYLKLKYCGYAHGLFERVLQTKQFVGETKDPAARLFAQFHAPQTTRMKKSIIAEIKKEDSRIRVVFATSALGMGVDTPYVEYIVHITPPSNIESYVQETGRAGRTGIPSRATLYYNNSDIAANKVHIQEPMKVYCRSQETCLRKLILEYLGFPGVTQQRCCCICDQTCNNVAENVPKSVKPKVRALPSDNKTILEELILSELNDFDNNIKASGIVLFDCSFLDDKNPVGKIIEGIEFIKSEVDLLETYGIWDETCSSKIFSLITKYAPLIQDSEH